MRLIENHARIVRTPATLFLLLHLLFAFGTLSDVNANPNLSEMREQVKKRLDALQTVEAELSHDVAFTPPLEAFRRITGRDIDAIRGDRQYRETFSFLEGRVIYGKDFVAGSPEAQVAAEAIRKISIFTGERVEQMNVFRGKRPIGTISNTGNFPDSVIDLALGLRAYGSQTWNTEATFADDDAFKLEEGRFRILNVQADLRHEWTFLSNPSIELISYRVFSDDVLVREYICGDFHDVDGILLPYRVDYSRYSRVEGKHFLQEKHELVVQHYRLHSSTNVPDQYKIKWPIGSVVRHVPLDVQLIVKSATQPLDDDKIYKSVQGEKTQDQDATSRAKETIDKILNADLDPASRPAK